MSVKKLKLGKRPARFDARTPLFHHYLARLAPAHLAPPKKQDWAKASGVKAWGVMLNDVLGCCVVAEKGHCVELWTALAGSHRTVRLPDAVILAGYEAVGGYVPGQPSTDQGCDMLTAQQYFLATGFGGHRLSAFAALTAGAAMNAPHWRISINCFGAVPIGVELPLAWQGKTNPGDVWDVDPRGSTAGEWAPGSWGGHDVPLVGYDAAADVWTLLTWGQVQYVTTRALQAYCTEAYTDLSPDWIAAGVAPNRLSLAALQDELAHDSLKALPKIDWPALLARVKWALQTFGPAVLPLVQGWVAALPLTPVEVAALEALIAAVLGKKVALHSLATRGF